MATASADALLEGDPLANEALALGSYNSLLHSPVVSWPISLEHSFWGDHSGSIRGSTDLYIILHPEICLVLFSYMEGHYFHAFLFGSAKQYKEYAQVWIWSSSKNLTSRVIFVENLEGS